MAEEMSIKKQSESIDKQERNLQSLKERLKSKCDHSRGGEPDIVPSNNRGPGNSLRYVCRKCRKELNLSKIPDEQLKSSLEVIDNACDAIKLTLNKDREDDQKVLKRVAKTQYRVRNEIGQLYNAALKRNRKSERRSNDGNRNESSPWSKPRVDR